MGFWARVCSSCTLPFSRWTWLSPRPSPSLVPEQNLPHLQLLPLVLVTVCVSVSPRRPHCQSSEHVWSLSSHCPTCYWKMYMTLTIVCKSLGEGGGKAGESLSLMQIVPHIFKKYWSEFTKMPFQVKILFFSKEGPGPRPSIDHSAGGPCSLPSVKPSGSACFPPELQWDLLLWRTALHC